MRALSSASSSSAGRFGTPRISSTKPSSSSCVAPVCCPTRCWNAASVRRISAASKSGLPSAANAWVSSATDALRACSSAISSKSGR